MLIQPFFVQFTVKMEMSSTNTPSANRFFTFGQRACSVCAFFAGTNVLQLYLFQQANDLLHNANYVVFSFF